MVSLIGHIEALSGRGEMKIAKYRKVEYPNEWFLTNFTMEQIERRLESLEQRVIELKNKNDELVELAAWYLEVSIFYWVETTNWYRAKDTLETYDAMIELTLSYQQAEEALRKAVEEK
jgi:hypothetical protein